jgi:aminoglycoside phosphotransferase (APT) family kinase protein
MAEAANAQDLFSGTKPVVDSHKFNEANLAAWMQAHVEGYEGPLEVRQFKGGQSNPTYQLVTPKKKYVMRRKPPGNLLPSAHAVDREFTIISALYPLGYPVARPYGLCTDDSVVGTMFYIMDMMEGRILWDGTLPDYEPAMRRKIYEAKVKTFADLHNVDWKKAGLEGYGKEGDYIARQIHRWTKQYKASETMHIPEMEKLIEWLPKNIPPGDTTTIVHGDYRLDNCMVDARGSVVAVLDWEICTLGDPLADVGLLQVYWNGPNDAAGAWSGTSTSAPGFWDRPQLAERYAEVSGRDLSQLDFYVAFAFWKLACIIEGVYSRYLGGALGDRPPEELAPFKLQVEQAAATAEKYLDALA